MWLLVTFGSRSRQAQAKVFLQRHDTQPGLESGGVSIETSGSKAGSKGHQRAVVGIPRLESLRWIALKTRHIIYCDDCTCWPCLVWLRVDALALSRITTTQKGGMGASLVYAGKP